VEVSSEELEYDEELGMYLGSQELEVEMLDGEEKGEIISVTNYLTKTHSVYAEEGTKIIISADRPEGTEPYYSVYNYDRTLPYVSSLLILAAAIIATTLGVFLALVLFMLMSWMLHLKGFSSSEAEDLILINEATGLRIKDLLFAGVLISSLGAIMDVGMSIVSALFELLHHNPELSAGELFKSGIEIGKDMIGTMTNTLILAFTGSAFITLLVFVSYQVQANQLFNSNYIAIEIAQGICGTFGIVLTVPIASAVSAVMLIRNKKEQEQIVTFQTHANNKHQK